MFALKTICRNVENCTIQIFVFYSLKGPYSKNYLSDRSFTNENDYEFVDNFATPDTAQQIGIA